MSLTVTNLYLGVCVSCLVGFFMGFQGFFMVFKKFFKGQSISTTFELREVALERTKKRLGTDCHIFYGFYGF